MNNEEPGTQQHYHSAQGKPLLQRPMFQNKRGEWVPATPEPYFHIIRLECECGKKFLTREGYEGHYAYRHIVNPLK